MAEPRVECYIAGNLRKEETFVTADLPRHEAQRHHPHSGTRPLFGACFVESDRAKDLEHVVVVVGPELKLWRNLDGLREGRGVQVA